MSVNERTAPKYEVPTQASFKPGLLQFTKKIRQTGLRLRDTDDFSHKERANAMPLRAWPA
jgi:hypothetical protein